MMDLVRESFRTRSRMRWFEFSGTRKRSGRIAQPDTSVSRSSKALICMKLRMGNVFASAGRPAALPFSRLGVLAGIVSASVLAGCAQGPAENEAGGVWRKSNTKEYFGQKRYGKASPRVVRNGRRVPKGGGRAIIGRPYKVAGKRYYPRAYKPGQTQFGKASWYGDAFHGRKTANGEIYDMSSVTAAHPTMPLPS